MVVSDAEVIMPENETGRQGHSLLVISHRLVKRALMKIQVAEQMVSQYVLRVGCQQALEFPARFLTPPLSLMDEGEEQALVHEGVAEKHPAFRAEFVLFTGRTTAARAANRNCVCHRYLH